ncbi:hypothetical protein KR032_007024, partial [Drosophila birchii]
FKCKMNLKVTIVVVLATLSLIQAKDATYELVFSDGDLHSSCKDVAPGTLDVHGLFDISEITTSLEEGGMRISGNFTFVWDIQPQDRIKAVIKLLYFDRGTWIPTFYTVTSNDFCNLMYNSNSNNPWNFYWLRHVTNLEDVKDKCMNPGTKLILETYLLGATMTMAKMREGLYKVQCTYHAFDANGTERPTNICYEFVGQLQEI